MQLWRHCNKQNFKNSLINVSQRSKKQGVHGTMEGNSGFLVLGLKLTSHFLPLGVVI